MAIYFCFEKKSIVAISLVLDIVQFDMIQCEEHIQQTHGLKYDPMVNAVYSRLTTNAQQQAWVPRVLGDEHYKGLTRVTVGVAH